MYNVNKEDNSMKFSQEWTRVLSGKMLEGLFEGSEVEYLGYVGKQSFVATLSYADAKFVDGRTGHEGEERVEKVLTVKIRAMDG